MAELLRIEGLRAGYGETVVLEDVALALPERGTLALLGRNGVGKTTLLASIMGHTTRHSGEVPGWATSPRSARSFRRSLSRRTSR